MGCFSLVNTELNWLFRAFALSRSLIIGWSFTRSVGMYPGNNIVWANDGS